MAKIKPCPFCGFPAQAQRTKSGSWKVVCLNADVCPSKYSFFAKDMAIKEWNRREKPRKEEKKDA